MRRMLIVSNRLPISVTKKRGNLDYVPSACGLATGLSSFYQTYESVWIGWPGIIAVAVFVFINAWNNYLYAFALTSSQNLRVLPQEVLSFLGNWITYWGGLTAEGMLVLLPPVILFLFFQKWFIAGIFGQQLK